MKYTVIAPFVQLYSGVLTLTQEQAATRTHNLRKTKAGYEIVNPVQFKRGEKIGYDGDITHELAEALGVKGKNKDASSVQTSAQSAPDGNTPSADVAAPELGWPNAAA